MAKKLKIEGPLSNMDLVKKIRWAGLRDYQCKKVKAVVMAQTDKYTAQGIADAVGVSRSTIFRWLKLYLKLGAERLLVRKIDPKLNETIKGKKRE